MGRHLCLIKKVGWSGFGKLDLKFEFVFFRLQFGMQGHLSIVKQAEYTETSLLDISTLRLIESQIPARASDCVALAVYNSCSTNISHLRCFLTLLEIQRNEFRCYKMGRADGTTKIP